jgi:hypothetical protein
MELFDLPQRNVLPQRLALDLVEPLEIAEDAFAAPLFAERNHIGVVLPGRPLRAAEPRHRVRELLL